MRWQAMRVMHCARSSTAAHYRVARYRRSGVVQLIKDYEDPVEVNVQLEQMGYNIGIRLVDEFCAKNRNSKCRNFRETMETVAKV